MDFFLTQQGFLFSPGLGLENVLGFDTAYNTAPNSPIWNLFPRQPGVIATPQLWNNPTALLRDPNALPPFRLNLFIQYKRPVYITRENWTQTSQLRWSYWRNPYFRYDIDQNQLLQLLILEQNTYHNASILYAAPAFRTHIELHNHYRNNQIIQNSNFVEPRHLRTHTVYTYRNSGNYGLGFSEPSEIPLIDIFQKIDEEMSKAIQYKDNYEFIERLYDSIDSTIKSYEFGNKRYLTVILKETFSKYEIIDKLAKITLYTLYMDLAWSIVFKSTKSEDVDV